MTADEMLAEITARVEAVDAAVAKVDENESTGANYAMVIAPLAVTRATEASALDVPALVEGYRAILALLPTSWEGNPYRIADGLVDESNLDDVVRTAVDQGQGYLAAQVRAAIEAALDGAS